MKSKTVIASLIAAIAFAPAFALAQTTTDNTATEIAALQQLIVLLTQELQQLIAQHEQSAAPTSAPTTVTASPTSSTPQSSTSYSSYTPVSMDVYSDDPSAYVGSDVVVEGMVNTFMPEGGTGGSTNYIQIINPFDESQPKMQLEVDDSSAYSAAVTALQNTSNPIYQFIRAYGVGVPDQELTETNLLGSENVMVPVVNVTRVDQCIHGSMNTTVLTGTSFDDNFTCTEWETVAPSSEAGTTYSAPATTPTATQSTPTSATSQTSTQTPITPTLSLSNPSVVYDGSPQAAIVTSSVPGNVVSIEYNGSATAPTMPGTYAVTALFAPSADPSDYSARLSAGTFTITAGNSSITPANQTITFNPLQNVTNGIVGFTIDAQASSGLGVDFAATGNCTVSGGPGTASVYVTGVGSCTITASQPGNQYYNPAPNVSQTFSITSALDSNATLSSLTVNGTAVSGFNPSTYTYAVTLPAGSPQAPTVAATVDDPTATDVITQATDSLGTATIIVTAQNGTTRNTYTVNFKPADAGQCDFNGSIFTCAPDSGITVSPTTLPNATVGTSYSEPVTISDPDTSSQNFRWNGIAGTFPPGLGLVFNGSTAFECSGTYCYFASAPQGVSVPSGAAAAFFGTPTAAGTYSFTMQAIDASDYTALPTFTLTVASSSAQ